MLSRLPLIAVVAVAAFAADAFAGHSSNSNSCKSNTKSHCKTKKTGFSFHIRLGSSHSNHNHNRKKYVAGHWTTRQIRYCVTEACYKVVTYPPVYAVRYDHCGKPYRVMVRPETRRRVYHPATYGYRTVRHYVPGRWVTCSH